MPINPAIALQFDKPHPVDILGTAGQVLTLKNLVEQGRMQALQIAQAEREDQRRQSIADLARQSNGDMGAFLKGYRGIDPLGAMDLQMKSDKARSEIGKDRIAMAENYNKLALGAAMAVRDAGYTQAAYDTQRSRLEAMGVPQEILATIPPVASKEYIDQTIASGLTFQDRIAREKLDWERKGGRTMLSKLMADEEEYMNALPDQTSTEIGSNGAVVVRAPQSPHAAAILREQYGEPPPGYQWGSNGKPVPMPEVLAQREKERRASASNIQVAGGDMALGKAAQTKIDEGLLDTSAALMRIDRIGREYRPEWSTFLKQGEMGLRSLTERLGGKLSPAQQNELAGYTSWRSSSLDNMNRTIKELTGSAMGVAEAERIISTLPNPDDSPSQFMRKLDDAKQATRMALARLTYIKRNGISMEDVPLDKVPSLINERGAQLEADAKKKYPSMKPAEVQKLVKRQLSQEFGLLAD